MSNRLSYAAYAESWTEVKPDGSTQLHKFAIRGHYSNHKQVIIMADCECGVIVTGKAKPATNRREALDRVRINWKYHIWKMKDRLRELQ